MIMALLENIVRQVIKEYTDKQTGFEFHKEPLGNGDVEKDQYYTHYILANQIISYTLKTISDFYQGPINVIEPCVGVGSFGRNRMLSPGTTTFGITINDLDLRDIDTEQFYNNNIDFDDTMMVPSDDIHINKVDATTGQMLIAESVKNNIPTLYITNPPFELDEEILSHITNSKADFISVILPRQYYEQSLSGYNLIQSQSLPDTAFKQRNGKGNVRCCWNMYVKTQYTTKGYDNIKRGDNYDYISKDIQGTVYFTTFNKNINYDYYKGMHCKSLISTNSTSMINGKSFLWKCDNEELDIVVMKLITNLFNSKKFKMYCSQDNGFSVNTLIDILNNKLPNVNFVRI